MSTILKSFWSDEAGFLISSELVLVATIGVLGTIAGLAEIAAAITTELNDVSNAIGSLNQSFIIPGTQGSNIGVSRAAGTNATVAGSQFIDHVDPGDANEIALAGAASETAQ